MNRNPCLLRGALALVVNLDYASEANVGVCGPASLEVSDADTGQGSPAGGARADLCLPGGGGWLLRAQAEK